MDNAPPSSEIIIPEEAVMQPGISAVKFLGESILITISVIVGLDDTEGFWLFLLPTGVLS